MLITLDSIGMRLTYDREGRYPINISEPIDLPSYQKEFDCYMSLKQPKQLEDGSWEWYQPNQSYYSYSDWDWRGYPDVTDAGAGFGVKVGHKLKTYKENIKMKNIFIEEIGIFESSITLDRFKNWTSNKTPLVSDDNGEFSLEQAKESKLYKYFKPDGSNFLRYEDVMGEEYFFDVTPGYISGVNFKAVNLMDNELFFSMFGNNKNFTICLRISVPSKTWNNSSYVNIFEGVNLDIGLDLLGKNIVFTFKGLVGTEKELLIPTFNNSNEFFDIYLSYNNGEVLYGTEGNIKKIFVNSILRPKHYLYKKEESLVYIENIDTGGNSAGYNVKNEVFKDSNTNLDYIKKLYFNEYSKLETIFKTNKHYNYPLSEQRGGYTDRWADWSRKYVYFKGMLKEPRIGYGSKLTVKNIDGPFYLWPWMNIMLKQRIYKNIQRIHPISGKLETVSSELIIV